MLGLVKAEQMDPKIHIMEAPVFFLQCYFNFLKLIITNKESCSYRQEPKSIEESQLHQN